MSSAAIRSLREVRRPPAGERCELCSKPLGIIHPHLLERSTKRLVCSCHPCVVLFSYRTEDRNLVRIPSDARNLEDFQLTGAQWNALLLPIDLAFFVRLGNSGDIAAYYPSPAGNIQATLPSGAWQELASANPCLSRLQPDVEALLVNRTLARHDYFVAPIDQCYRLTGLIRLRWRGLSGGEAVWSEIAGFFDSLALASTQEAAHA